MILKLKPFLRSALWGGQRLREEYGKVCELENVAESWELSCHPVGMTLTENDVALADFIAMHREVLGGGCEKMPLLVKLIDARENLSVQVHPTAAYAAAHPGTEGKNEMWYILDCAPDSHIIRGFREDMTRESVRAAIADGTLLDKVNKIPVKKGDVFYIPAGTIHALGKGCLAAEIQQSSDTTFRVYDYGRGRQLHIGEALDVLELRAASVPVQTSGKVLADCEYFRVCREDVDGESEPVFSRDSFTHLMITEGRGEVLEQGKMSGRSAKKGESFFISAGTRWQVKGKCSVIYTVKK
ncbi:MAG: class I mannose-6-phosphate isomerase [Ruminococcus sp.]|nr:class I mannose-6-phosphate isomerase [Ruminococcus sp.]